MDWRAAKTIPSSIDTTDLLYKSVRHGLKVLDIGCGEGRLSVRLSQAGCTVTGIDINENALKRAKENSKDVEFCLADATQYLPFDNNVFDLGVMNAFLTVVIPYEKRLSTLKESYRVLKNNGRLYIADFLQNWDIPLYRSRYEEGMSLGLEKGTFPVREGEEILYYAHHFTKEEITDLLKDSGFIIKDFITCKHKTRSGNLISGFQLIAQKGKTM